MESGRALALTAAAERALVHHRWAGNVRELENAIERAVVLCDGEEIGTEHVVLDAPPSEQKAVPAGRETLQEAMDTAAAARIRAALTESENRKQEAAAALGVDRTTLYRLMKRYRLGTEE